MPTIKIVPFPGAPGPRGDQGPRGYQGDQGISGLNGTDGKSAYEIAVDNGFVGTEQEWLDYISGNAGPQTWTAPNDAFYQINQAHGGVQIELAQPQSWSETITVVGNQTNSNVITVSVSSELNAILLDIQSGVHYFRNISMDAGAQTRYFLINSQIDVNLWQLYLPNTNITVYDQNQYFLNVEYGGAPIVWWDADTLGIMPEGDQWKFRGAKIDYHAYSADSGNIVGTIYIVDDSGDGNVTHIETSSGGNDTGNVILWNRYGNESQLYAYRMDSEGDTLRIHWTAQVYYGTETWD